MKRNPTFDRDTCVKMYLDWVNNFFTVARFAEHYCISEEQSRRIIILGKLQHMLDRRVAALKEQGRSTKTLVEEITNVR